MAGSHDGEARPATSLCARAARSRLSQEHRSRTAVRGTQGPELDNPRGSARRVMPRGRRLRASVQGGFTLPVGDHRHGLAYRVFRRRTCACVDRRNRPHENRRRSPRLRDSKRSGLDERRRALRPRERRRRRPLKKPIATGRRLSCAWVYSLAQPDRTALQHRAWRIQIPRTAQGRGHLDSRDLEETSVGNYSEQTPADPKLRMDSANAIDSGASASSARRPSRKRAVRSMIRAACASHPRVGSFRIYRLGSLRDCMKVRKRQIRSLKPFDEVGYACR